jgi:hypothetical protein
VLFAREIPVPWPSVHCSSWSCLLECPLGTLLYLNTNKEIDALPDREQLSPQDAPTSKKRKVAITDRITAVASVGCVIRQGLGNLLDKVVHAMTSPATERQEMS